MGISPFGKFRVAIETTDKKAPVRGLMATGRNGFYYCYQSINTYAESVALSLKQSLERRTQITAVNIFME